MLFFVQKRLPPRLACFLQNIFVSLRGSKVRFSFDREKSLFVAQQGRWQCYFGEMERGFGFYEKSIEARGQYLAASYCLQNVNFQPDDVVIDCGANYGDLFIYLADKINAENYMAFEPGPAEFKCLEHNLPDARLFNLGLSDENGRFDFYLKSQSGDSSLVRPKDYEDIIKVDVKRLDDVLPSLNIEKCKLFKLEAEGFEPEILRGAEKFIEICDYVAVDGGRERGVHAEATLHIANNFLMRRGFEMIDIHGPYHRALYKKIYVE